MTTYRQSFVVEFAVIESDDQNTTDVDVAKRVDQVEDAILDVPGVVLCGLAGPLYKNEANPQWVVASTWGKGE